MSERQKFILNLIIELYHQDGVPVGSKRLLEEADLDYSSATIRNDMNKLEKEGLLEKTHTSSGRVPSNKGYRFYVDQLLARDRDNDKGQDLDQRFFKDMSASFYKLDDIINFSSEMLSHMTNYTAVVLGPEAHRQRLVGFKLIDLSQHQLMCLLVTDAGNVETLIFEKPRDFPLRSVKEMVAIIESEIKGLSLLKAAQRLQTDIPIILANHIQNSNDELLHQFTRTIHQQLSDSFAAIRGQMNLLEFLEGRSTDQVKSFLHAVGDQERWAERLSHQENDLEVFIGNELDDDNFNEFSLITASYTVANAGNGFIALLGPQNMAYSKNIKILQDFQYILPKWIDQFYKDIE